MESESTSMSTFFQAFFGLIEFVTVVSSCVLCYFKSQTHTFTIDTWLDCISLSSRLWAALIWYRHNDLIFKLSPFLSNQLKIITCFLASLALQSYADSADAATPPVAAYQPVLENGCESYTIDIEKLDIFVALCMFTFLSPEGQREPVSWTCPSWIFQGFGGPLGLGSSLLCWT